MTLNAALDRTCHGSEYAAARSVASSSAPALLRARATSRLFLVTRMCAFAARWVASNRSTGQQIEKSRRRPTPFAEAHGKASERVLPQACNQQMSSQAHKEGER